MSLSTGVLSILAEHGNAARDAGLHPHTMRRQLETAVDAYRRAVAAGDAVAIAESEERVNRLAADAAVKLAKAAIRLLEEETTRLSKETSALRGKRR